MTSLLFYSKNDLDQINDNLDQIEQSATKLSYQLLEPNNDEYYKIKQIIIDFIKEQKRIVYGGSAYHAIIQHFRSDKDSNNTIYPDWSRFDIEFYSPDPIRDLVMICNRINNIGIKYVIGRQAHHDETFTVFANFLQYCDMSYMPKIIFDKVNFIEIDNIRYIHPEMILIDIFRMFNDPLTSYFRLTKVFKRMKLLMDKFPFDFKKSDIIKFEHFDDNNKLINFLLPKIVNSDFKFLFTGQLAYLIYTNPNNKINTNDINQLEIISDDLENIVEFLKEIIIEFLSINKLIDKYDELFKISIYSRFFQYWDKRIVFFYKNNPIITVLGSANRCLPIINCQIDDRLNINLSSFLVTFNYFFIGYHYEKINNFGFYFKDRNIINSLITIRNDFLYKNNKTVIDKTIFREFIIECIGKTTEFGREYLLRINEKRKLGIKSSLSYDPEISKGTYIEYEFEQSDGNLIIFQ